MPGVWGGSSGVTSVARIERLIDGFYNLPGDSRTSARFADLWSSRAVEWLDVPLDYIIEQEGNTAAGWSSQIYQAYGSTRNTFVSSYANVTTAQSGIPNVAYAEFLADRTVLQAATSAIDGVTDAAQGRRLYQFLVSDAIVSSKYLQGPHREILVAWAAAGSSAAPTS